MPKLYNVSQTAALFNVSTQSVHYWIKTGKLEAKRINGSKNRLYITSEEIAKFEQTRNNKGKNKTKVKDNDKKEVVVKSKEVKETKQQVKVVENDLEDFTSTVSEMLREDALVAIKELTDIISEIKSKQDVTVSKFNEIIDRINLVDDIFDLIDDEFRPL